MNICFLYGKIISNIEFEFIIKGKSIAITYFYIMLNNNSKVKIVAYDEVADYCYANLIKGDYIIVEGYLEQNEVIIVNFEKL